jgi:hypothetical protein
LWKSSLPKNQKFFILNNRKGGNGNPQTDQKRLVVVIVEEEGEVPTSHKFCQGDFCQEEEGGHVPAAIHSFVESKDNLENKKPAKKQSTGIIIISIIIIFFFFFKLQKSNTTTIFFSPLLLQAPEIKYNHHLLLSSSSSSSRNQIQPPSSSLLFFFFKLQKSNTNTIFLYLLLPLQALFFPAPSGKLKIPQNTLQPIIIHHLSVQAHLIIFCFGNSKVCLHFFFFLFQKISLTNKNKTHQTKNFNFQINKQINEEIIIGAKKKQKKTQTFSFLLFLVLVETLFTLPEIVREEEEEERV